ncbi:MAG: sulfurtransferase TusA family protein [Deltaproteobacteria bacterium]|jgi:TusA-related sulfurtransferase|nr:sulfurtransferase TusA family protein [Deltaproteobacteria bacterium]
MSREVDARGLSCPQPIVLAFHALAEEPGPVTIIVDTQSAVESLKRLLSREKRTVEIIETMETTVFRIGPR